MQNSSQKKSFCLMKCFAASTQQKWRSGFTQSWWMRYVTVHILCVCFSWKISFLLHWAWHVHGLFCQKKHYFCRYIKPSSFWSVAVERHTPEQSYVLFIALESVLRRCVLILLYLLYALTTIFVTAKIFILRGFSTQRQLVRC